MKEQLLYYSKKYHDMMMYPVASTEARMPGEVYFIDGNTILALPRDEGDSRYPYGKDGFNYWTYASGYMHSNEGLYSLLLRASEGAEPKVAFFAGINEREMFSLLSVPVMSGEPADLIRYTLFTMSATYYMAETQEAIFAIRTFVDRDRHIYYTLEVINKLEMPLDIKLSTYFNPFLKNAMMENSTDRWFRMVEYIEDKESFKIEVYEERDRLGMATNYGILNRVIHNKNDVESLKVTTSRYDYVGGIKSSLHTAKVIKEGDISKEKHICSFTETSICGDMLFLKVKDESRIDLKFSYCFEEADARALINQTYTKDEVDSLLAEVICKEKENQKGMKLRFNEANDAAVDLKLTETVFNGFMEHLKKQVEFCSVIKGYVQLSSFSLIGIRDIFQALEGLVYWQPEVVRAKMLEAMAFMTTEGRLPRQYALPVSKNVAPTMDLRPFIDQGVWVISTIATYLRQTKDITFLTELCGYHDFLDEHKHIARKSLQEDTILEHMFKIMDYLLKNRDNHYTKCVLALYGDWNDALDGLGKSKDPNKDYGTGVSVMATLQVYQNLDEMIEILDYLDQEGYKDKINGYKKAQLEISDGLHKHALLEDRILHGWGDNKSYFVGSNCDPDGLERDGLTSNAFWILSGLLRKDYEKSTREGVLGEKIQEIILKAYDRLDSKYGFRTFNPHFEKGTEGIGRIPNLPKGTAENGATYIHGSMFGVMSLFAIGESERAWHQLAKLLPFTHESISVSPYVEPNSYSYNEVLGIDGESMADWQTGSSNVLLKTVIRYVYGYAPALDGFYVQPSRYQPFKHLEMSLSYLGRQIDLSYRKASIIKRTFTMNGRVLSSSHDKMMKLDSIFISDDVIKTIPLGSHVKIIILDPLNER